MKVNQALIFEYTPTVTQNLECKLNYNLEKGNCLVTTRITCYNKESPFNDCESTEDVIDNGYYIKVNLGYHPLLNTPIIDLHNNLFTTTQQTVINNQDEQTVITVKSNLENVVMLKGVKSITIVFEKIDLE